MRGIVFDITEVSVHDGPGLRTAVFLKGCPMRCRWCHSPESWSPEPETLFMPGEERLCGTVWEDDRLAEFLRDCASLTRPVGGITFSGGEPLMQADFLVSLLSRLEGIHTLVETSGCCPTADLLRAASRCSMMYYGLKILDETSARYWTGRGSKQILDNLRALDAMGNGPEVVLRLPLIAGAVTEEENLRALMELCRSLKRLKGIEFLPANPLAPAKYALCRKNFDPACAECRTGEVPGWFDPGVPWRRLT